MSLRNWVDWMQIVSGICAAWNLLSPGMAQLQGHPQAQVVISGIVLLATAASSFFLVRQQRKRIGELESRLPAQSLSVTEMQNTILVNWAGEGPTLFVNKSPQLQMVRLHVCNRIPQKMKLKHITLNLMVNHIHLQEAQRYLDQAIPAHDCGDVMFQLPLNADTADTLQTIDPSIVTFQGMASVSVGEQDFSVSFNTSTTFRVLLDPNALQS